MCEEGTEKYKTAKRAVENRNNRKKRHRENVSTTAPHAMRDDKNASLGFE